MTNEEGENKWFQWLIKWLNKLEIF
jgi:hypothetical protein